MIRETTAAVTAPTLIIVIRDIQPPNVRATVKCQINYTEKTLKSDFTKVPNFTALSNDMRDYRLLSQHCHP